MPCTIVEYYSKQNSSQCGYCKGKRSSHSHGMHAYVMTPQDYQDLIDRGWRRSGSYCYKPNNKITCCPSYTIRCDVSEFKLSKSHKKILKRMNKFLTDGIKEKADDEPEGNSSGQNKSGGEEEECSAIREHPDIPKKPKKDIDMAGLASTRLVVEEAEESQQKGLGLLEPTEVCQSRVKENAPRSGDTLLPRKKAKQIRLERKQAKLAAKGVSIDTIKEQAKTNKNQEKSLCDYIEGVPENSHHKLRVTLVQSNKEVTAVEYALFRKYQMAVHHDPPTKITEPRFENFLVKSPLKLKLVGVKSDEFNITLRESFGLYTKYQTLVHNDPPDGVSDYLNFLVRSPLQLNLSGGTSCGFGSFHQQYWLDDKLIAVGVIDILPSCVSSVYFFYDPDYSFLSLGTYGSLREINFILQLNEQLPSLKYYYMGFYIHSCPKMRYKGKLVPSYLLCPEVYTWHLLTEEIRAKLEQNKYCRFNENPNAKDKNEFTEQAINSILITVDGRSCIRYGEFSQLMVDDNLQDMLLEYGQLVGKICAQRMLYVK